MLDKEEKKRYNRHLILDQVGLEGQIKLKEARVLVIGAGGLGCPILSYLAAAGVGTIGIIDYDSVDLSNLQRQVLFTVDDIGTNKASAAAKRLNQLNPHINFEIYTDRLDTINALEIFSKYDMVVDGTDNFATRYLVNDASLITNKPLIYGSIYKFQGQVSVFNFKDGPSYRCLFPTPPEPGTIKNCSEIGVIGVLPGIIGAQQANEAIKIILGIGEPLSGKLMIYDALKANYMTVGITRSDSEIERVMNRADQLESFDYELFCGVNKAVGEQVDLEAFKNLINTDAVQIVDLRDDWEVPELSGTNVERITMSELNQSIERFSREKKVILVCQTGMRSTQVKTLLESQYKFDNIIELKGGIEDYDN